MSLATRDCPFEIVPDATNHPPLMDTSPFATETLVDWLIPEIVTEAESTVALLCDPDWLVKVKLSGVVSGTSVTTSLTF